MTDMSTTEVFRVELDISGDELRERIDAQMCSANLMEKGSPS